MDDLLPRMLVGLQYSVVTNARNFGFLRSANIGLEQARARRLNALILNSDAFIAPGVLTELMSVMATDRLNGFVSPRSNNATICNSPYPGRFRALDECDARAAHLAIQHRLPRQTVTPTTVGFCMLIHWRMLVEFGIFDPVFGEGYNEETDLVLRAGRAGYRALLANHAFVYHIGSASFELTEKSPLEREVANRRILLERFPFYDEAVQRYFTSADYRAESLLGGFVEGLSGRPRLLFDSLYLGCYYNGTFKVTVSILKAFAEAFPDDFELVVACSPAAWDFHDLGAIPGLGRFDGASFEAGDFAACVRLSPPFSEVELRSFVAAAPVTIAMIHDTIALDCLALNQQNLGRLWGLMSDAASGLVFTSESARTQYKAHFSPANGLAETTALLSTSAAEYQPMDAPPLPGSAILVVGNHYAHKACSETVEALLAQVPHGDILVLGAVESRSPRVRAYPSGELDPVQIDGLYAAASVVVYPSHHEGFGLPILEALARKRPVVARRLPSIVEIAMHVPQLANVHLADTTVELATLAAACPPWSDRRDETIRVRSWGDVASDLRRLIAECTTTIDKPSLARRMRALADPAAGRHDSVTAPASVARRPWAERLQFKLAHFLELTASRQTAEQLVAKADSGRDVGDFARAAAFYRSALRLKPAMAGIWVQYGHALKETGKVERATAAYGKALALESDTADTHLQLGHALKLQNRHQEARAAFETSLALDPDLAAAKSELQLLEEGDRRHLRRAMMNAHRARGRNAVGVVTCVVAQGSQVLFAGGSDKALAALLRSSGRVRHATVYLAAEPTPALARVIERSPVPRVLIAREARSGTLHASARLTVQRGVLQDEAKLLDEAKSRPPGGGEPRSATARA